MSSACTFAPSESRYGCINNCRSKVHAEAGTTENVIRKIKNVTESQPVLQLHFSYNSGGQSAGFQRDSGLILVQNRVRIAWHL